LRLCGCHFRFIRIEDRSQESGFQSTLQVAEQVGQEEAAALRLNCLISLQHIACSTTATYSRSASSSRPLPAFSEGTNRWVSASWGPDGRTWGWPDLMARKPTVFHVSSLLGAGVLVLARGVHPEASYVGIHLTISLPTSKRLLPVRTSNGAGLLRQVRHVVGACSSSGGVEIINSEGWLYSQHT